MKRLMGMLVLGSLLVAAVSIGADSHSKMKMGAAKTETWKGEVVDAGCFLGHGAMGAKHKECAMKCAANGMPLMLRVGEGKLYLLTPNHDNADAYNSLKDMAGDVVEITGTMMTHEGVKGIDVTGAKVAAAAASK